MCNIKIQGDLLVVGMSCVQILCNPFQFTASYLTDLASTMQVMLTLASSGFISPRVTENV